MTDLNGKHIVVTGAAGGIGKEVVNTLVGQNAMLTLIDIDSAGLASLASAYPEWPPHTIESGLEGVTECRRIASTLSSPVYGLVHLAGVYEADPDGIDAHGVWDRAIQHNLANAYDLIGALLPSFDSEVIARIVLTASLAFRRGSFDQCLTARRRAVWLVWYALIRADWHQTSWSMGLRQALSIRPCRETSLTNVGTRCCGISRCGDSVIRAKWLRSLPFYCQTTRVI